MSDDCDCDCDCGDCDCDCGDCCCSNSDAGCYLYHCLLGCLDAYGDDPNNDCACCCRKTKEQEKQKNDNDKPQPVVQQPGRLLTPTTEMDSHVALLTPELTSEGKQLEKKSNNK